MTHAYRSLAGDPHERSSALPHLVQYIALPLLIGAGTCMPALSVQPASQILFDSPRSGTEEIFVTDPYGSNVRQLTHVGREEVTSWLPDWSPDRRRIVFSSNRTGPWDDLYVMDADGRNVWQLTDTPEASEHDAAWSPDGRYIAYDRAEIAPDGSREAAQIWIVGADGSDARALTNRSSRNMRPAWSPDGSIIAFMSDRHAEFDTSLLGTDDGDLEIYLMKRDGSDVRRVTECTGTASSPAWSPDGQGLAFACGGGDQPPHNRGLHVTNANGSDQRRLITGYGFRPAWSPDGKEIAYNCNPYGQALQFEQFEICVISVNESGLRVLTRNNVFDGHPDWW